MQAEDDNNHKKRSCRIDFKRKKTTQHINDIDVHDTIK